MNAAADWVSITNKPVKRKRAELACEYCHSKKVKCDLLARTAQQLSKCTNCANASRECRGRPSQRANSGRRAAKPGRAVKAPATVNEDGGASLPEGRTVSFPDALASVAVPDNDFVNIPTPSTFETSEQQPVSASAAGLTSSALHQVNGTTPQYSHESPNTRLTGSRVDQGPHYPDSGFQYVYGPENSLDAQDQEQSSAKPPNLAYELPGPDLQQSFLDSYFDYCYSWCPVIDRATASYEISRSPMLTNAIALAGSHLKPPIIPHDGPSVYYDRARRMFYEDEEVDSLTSLKALCLFYWWSPKPPTIVHRQ